MAANVNIDLVRKDIFLGLKEVSNEPTGFIQSVNTNTGAETAAIGDQIKIPVGTAGEVEDTPVGYSNPTEGTSDVGANTMAITDSKTVKIDWKGEHQKAVMNSGVLGTVLAQQFADAFRKLRNEIEKAAYKAAIEGASRAYGTAGTTPFGTANDMSDLANLQGILDANGAPESNRTIILSPAAKINLLSKQMNMIKVNESGSEATLRSGIIMPTYGFNVRSSAAASKHVKSGAGTIAINAESGYAAGAKELAIDGATAAPKAGDIVTIGSAADKYVVGEGSTTTKLVLNPKGLVNTAADDDSVGLVGDYVASVALHRNAVALAIRPPAVPEFNGQKMDTALAREYVTDPLTNITYEVAVYGGQRMLQFQVSVAWGAKAVNGEFIATLIG
jgi:hypothetical protein